MHHPQQPEARITGTVAAINRRRALAAIRCNDGRYSLVAYDKGWTPVVGEWIAGELTRLGPGVVSVGTADRRQVEVHSFNCTAAFARSRLEQ